jgi:hypothetical protein
METVKYTTYILHITATHFGYMNIAIIRPKHVDVTCKIYVLYLTDVSILECVRKIAVHLGYGT